MALDRLANVGRRQESSLQHDTGAGQQVLNQHGFAVGVGEWNAQQQAEISNPRQVLAIWQGCGESTVGKHYSFWSAGRTGGVVNEGGCIRARYFRGPLERGIRMFGKNFGQPADQPAGRLVAGKANPWSCNRPFMTSLGTMTSAGLTSCSISRI